jgi:hypothetical protein
LIRSVQQPMRRILPWIGFIVIAGLAISAGQLLSAFIDRLL